MIRGRMFAWRGHSGVELWGRGMQAAAALPVAGSHLVILGRACHAKKVEGVLQEEARGSGARPAPPQWKQGRRDRWRQRQVKALSGPW